MSGETKCAGGVFFPLIYMVVGFLTFALIHHDLEGDCDNPYRPCNFSPGAVIGGAAWPIYWGGLFALKIVRFETAKPKQLSCTDGHYVWTPTDDGVCILPQLIKP